MDVAFKVVDGDEGDVLREGQGLGVGDADEQSTGEARAGGNGDGVEIGEGDVGLGESGADDGDDGAEVLAAGEFGNDSAVASVGGDLGGDGRGEGAGAALYDGGGGLVAGGFDGEDKTDAHLISLSGGALSGVSPPRRVSRATRVFAELVRERGAIGNELAVRIGIGFAFGLDECQVLKTRLVAFGQKA